MSFRLKKEIFIFISFFSVLSYASFTFAAEHPRYDIKATIDVDHKSISATEKVTFTNPEMGDIQELYFHIYPNRQFTKDEKDLMLRYSGFFKVNAFPEGFQTPKFEVRAIKKGDQLLSFALEGKDQTLLRVVLDSPLPSGQTVEVDLDFNLTIPHAYGRLGWNENIITLSRWYPILSAYKDGVWKNYPFYPFHRPFFADASQYNVELTTASNQVVIHSGALVKEEPAGHGMKTLFIDSKLPIREFSLAMSTDYQVYEQKWNDITIKSFYLPGDLDHAKKAWAAAQGMMTFYSKLLGPYPYEVFNIAPVYLGYGGEQMSNLAYMDTRTYQLPGALDRYFDFLVAHETGHQWLYNVIGINEYSEIWLEEGVHSFFVSEYLAEKYGRNAEILIFPKWAEKSKWFLPELTFNGSRDFRYKTLTRIGIDHPVVSELASFSEPSSIFAIAYGKGSRIVDMLDDILGKDGLNRVMAKIYKEYQFKNLSVKDFMAACQKETSRDLTPFFEQWLYTKDHFDVAVTTAKGNRIGLANKGGITMPVDGEVEFKDGTTEKFSWDSQNKKDEVTVNGSTPIKEVRLDPEKKLLDLDQTNNTWPRHLNIKPVALYHGLYDVALFLPEDSYNLVFGPELANGGIGAKASLQKPYEQNFYVGGDYEFGEQIFHSRVGYQLSNVFKKQTVLGFEIDNQTDYDNGDEDLVSGKVYWRHELWPVPYGLTSINDHVTLYMIRNQGLNYTSLLGGTEDSSNLSYLKRSEAIVGTSFHFERLSPSPDPSQGYKINTSLESSGHFLGATQYFNRMAVDTSFYHPVTVRSKMAFRLKQGWGGPDDKNLFQFGGIEGLRGYDRKTIRGSKGVLGSLEYRFPLKDNLHLSYFDHLLGIESVSGVVFFDGGQAWYGDIDQSDFKKDAGAGLRVMVNVGSFLEKVMIRLDVAQAINEPDSDPHFWFGVNQAF